MNYLFKSIKKVMLSLFILFIFQSLNAYATSWAKLTPEEVDKGAVVIAYGRYDFTQRIGDNKRYGAVFSPVKFEVEKYYRGEGKKVIATGIDMFDEGWVKEFQQDKGYFLLFLSKSKEDSNVLLPVGGPNGMVQVINGRVKAIDEKEEAYFNKILNSTSVFIPIQEEEKFSVIFSVATIFLIILALVGVYKYRTFKNRN